MTNIERIKNMSSKELADFFRKATWCCFKFGFDGTKDCMGCPLENACHARGGIETWLESEAEE